MYFIKLLADGDIVVAVETVEEPEYVQVLNGVTEVKEGMSLKIPKLKVKKKKKR